MYSIDPRRLTAHRQSGLTVYCKEALAGNETTQSRRNPTFLLYRTRGSQLKRGVSQPEVGQELLGLLVLSREHGHILYRDYMGIVFPTKNQ